MFENVLFISGLPFECKASKGQRFFEQQYNLIRNATEMMGHLDTTQGTLQECGNMCSTMARCHGFTHSHGNVCHLYNYYPLPEDIVIVGEYYQLHCA